MSIVDHIVVAVDFSEPSRVAARAALQLASQSGAKKLTVLHALRPIVLPHGEQPTLTRRLLALRDQIHEAAHAQMKAMAPKDAHTFDIDYQVVEGTPAKVIPGAARDLGGTLLALGTHARRGVRRWLKGSVVESMLPRLHLPALVFAEGMDGVEPNVELKNLKHVTVAVDTHDAAKVVARRASEAIGVLAATKPAVTLMTVVDTESTQMTPDDALVAEVQNMVRDDAKARLEPLTAFFSDAGMQITTDVRAGDVEDEILNVAESSQLIVMGTHVGGDALLDFSSTAADIIRHSNVSVLVLPCHRELDGAE